MQSNVDAMFDFKQNLPSLTRRSQMGSAPFQGKVALGRNLFICPRSSLLVELTLQLVVGNLGRFDEIRHRPKL